MLKSTIYLNALKIIGHEEELLSKLRENNALQTPSGTGGEYRPKDVNIIKFVFRQYPFWAAYPNAATNLDLNGGNPAIIW